MSSTILIVEDHPGSQQSMARLLRFQGYATLCAENGQEAFGALKLTRADLILLDLMMPLMDGVNFLKILRQNPAWSDLPVIVVTAKPLEDDVVREAHRLGAKACFMKAGFTFDQLLTSIRRYVPDA